jgi:hypothetical protein
MTPVERAHDLAVIKLEWEKRHSQERILELQQELAKLKGLLVFK